MLCLAWYWFVLVPLGLLVLGALLVRWYLPRVWVWALTVSRRRWEQED